MRFKRTKMATLVNSFNNAWMMPTLLKCRLINKFINEFYLEVVQNCARCCFE